MTRYHLFCLALLATLLCVISISCDETTPWSDTPPAVVPANGTIDYDVLVDGDSIDTSAPITTDHPSDTLILTIGQSSSYADPDGTVFTCGPRAGIIIYTPSDTIRAEDIAALTTVSESSITPMDQSGSNPVVHTASQRFIIGAQEIAVDYGYEVYTHTNSQSSTVEMPYLRLDAATEPKVSLSSLSLTRASIVDSTLFKVSAVFSMELESVNTKNENKETLEFAVNYVGVVENVTELYGSVVYTINDRHGEVKSPFVINGSDSLQLEIKEKSTYATPDSLVYTFEPKAGISLKVKNDTSFVERRELLTTLVETEEPEVHTQGKNPIANLYKELLATSSQEFLFETKYEVYTAPSGDEMPYLMIGEPKCIDIKITEQKKDSVTRAIVYDTVYYDVKAKFRIELNGVNVSDELAETLEFEVNYVGGVVDSTHIVELVKTTYRKDQVFYEGYGTLRPRSQCEVYRDRHYSDGHIETDEFFGVPWFWLEYLYGFGANTEIFAVDTTIVFSPDFSVTYGGFSEIINYKDLYHELHTSMQVPDMQYIEREDTIKGNDNPSEYDESYQAELKDYYFDPDSLVDGWYMKNYYKLNEVVLKYVKNDNETIFRYYWWHVSYYDRFFCIDDTIIGFQEYRPEFIRWTDRFEDFQGDETKGPGKIFIWELQGEYLGQKVYGILTDTIYTPKGTVVEKDDRDISVVLDAPTDITYVSATLNARVEGNEGDRFLKYGFYVQQPHTGKWMFFKADSVSADASYISVALNELEPGETYSYYAQVYVPNIDGSTTIESDTRTFTTLDKVINLATDDAVDLGLSVKWASRNVGAGAIEEHGEFYAWSSDLAEQALSGGWRMPSSAEMQELVEKCMFVEGKHNGKSGLYCIGPNGNAIFFPFGALEYVYMGEWEGKAEYMESGNINDFVTELWTGTKSGEENSYYGELLELEGHWAGCFDESSHEIVGFVFPNGEKQILNYSSDRMPKLLTDPISRRKAIRPVRE